MKFLIQTILIHIMKKSDSGICLMKLAPNYPGVFSTLH